MSNVIDLVNKDDWNEFRSQSEKELIVVKYSPRCGISKNILRTIDIWAKRNKDNDSVKLAKVDVVNENEVSEVIADEFGISHQSPQLIWFNSDMKIKNYYNHYEITAEVLNNISSKDDEGGN